MRKVFAPLFFFVSLLARYSRHFFETRQPPSLFFSQPPGRKAECRSALREMEQLESHNSCPGQRPRGFLQKVKCIFFLAGKPSGWMDGGHFLCTARKAAREKRNGTCVVCACALTSLPLCLSLRASKVNCQFARPFRFSCSAPFLRSRSVIWR